MQIDSCGQNEKMNESHENKDEKQPKRLVTEKRQQELSRMFKGLEMDQDLVVQIPLPTKKGQD